MQRINSDRGYPLHSSNLKSVSSFFTNQGQNQCKQYGDRAGQSAIKCTRQYRYVAFGWSVIGRSQSYFPELRQNYDSGWKIGLTIPCLPHW